MYIAMNRFKVGKGSADAFERMWGERESCLHECDGFEGFHLLRGPESDDFVLYASHTRWRDYDAFIGWTKSDQFRKAHQNAGNNSIRSLYLESPQFEGFEAVQEVTADGTKRVL